MPVTRTLAARTPFHGAGVLAFLAARAIPGLEIVADGAYRRVLSLPGGPAVVAVTPSEDGVEVVMRQGARADLPVALDAVSALFGLDANPRAVDAALGADPVLGPMVCARPGLRVPGAADGFEVAVRAILGQQITVVAARTLAGRITAALGIPLPEPCDGLTHAFPAPEALAAAPEELLTMPRTRADALRALGAARLPLGEPGDAAALTALRGVGPWTAGYVALRLGDPDVFLEGDVVLRNVLARHGETVTAAERWRPYRSYAVLHLWASATDAAAA